MIGKLRWATLAFGVAVAGLVAAASPSQTKDDQKVEKKQDKGDPLKTIKEVTVSLSKDKKELVVSATAEVPTGGWTDPRLTRREYVKPPPDGIYEYDFTALKPKGLVPQVVSEVKATDKWKNPPADVKGVKVYGTKDGGKTAKIEKGRIGKTRVHHRDRGRQEQACSEHDSSAFLGVLCVSVVNSGFNITASSPLSSRPAGRRRPTGRPAPRAAPPPPPPTHPIPPPRGG